MATSFFLFSSRRQLFVVVVWNFELYMLPLALLLLLVWNFMFSSGRETHEMVRKVGKHLSVLEMKKFTGPSCSCRSPWRPCLSGRTTMRTKRTR